MSERTDLDRFRELIDRNKELEAKAQAAVLLDQYIDRIAANLRGRGAALVNAHQLAGALEDRVDIE